MNCWKFNACTKDYLISKCPFVVFKSPKNTLLCFVRIFMNKSLTDLYWPTQMKRYVNTTWKPFVSSKRTILCNTWYVLTGTYYSLFIFRFENMTASTMTFLVPGFLFFFVIQLAGAMEEISILQNSTLKNHTVSS